MRLSFVSSLKVFSFDSCSKPASNCKLCFCMTRASPLPTPDFLKPPPWKTDSFTASVGITFSCGMPLWKNTRFLIRSLPSTLLSYHPLFPSSITLLLLLHCWMAAHPAFASCPSLCSSSCQPQLLQQPHNFDLQSFCPSSWRQCTNQTLPFFSAGAGSWCADLKVTLELRGLWGAGAPKGRLKIKAGRQNIPLRTPSSVLFFFLSVLARCYLNTKL